MRIVNAFGGFAISIASTEAPTSTTTEIPAGAPCTAQDFELMSLLDPAVLAEACYARPDTWLCLNEQLTTLLADSNGAMACFETIYGEPTFDTGSCIGDSALTDSRAYICEEFAYFASTFLQASKIVMEGACNQEDSVFLAAANYTDMAICIADEKNSFSDCWSNYPLDVSDSCSSLVESSMDGIFETCSGDCPSQNYTSALCYYCNIFGFPIGASYAVYNSASSIMSISLASLMFIALSMMNG
jgi:hypothetical protein